MGGFGSRDDMDEKRWQEFLSALKALGGNIGEGIALGLVILAGAILIGSCVIKAGITP